jgi:uncharacterized protein YndB with AHSA1/START domain/DNA-binding transcriptional ArsR family regulator
VESVFKALADQSRRTLLDQLFERDGQTLGELQASLPGMTRFGVMKHLAVLEAAGVISTRKAGREKFHYLNPVPIQQIADRWISKFAQPWVSALTGLKYNLEMEVMERPKHQYDLYIRATPERVWEGITNGDITRRWFHGTRFTAELTAGARLELVGEDGSAVVEGEILEATPPMRLVHTWKANWGPEFANDRPSRVTWELTPMGETTLLRLIHDDFDGETVTYQSISQGWAPILSSLKSLLETGEPLVMQSA